MSPLENLKYQYTHEVLIADDDPLFRVMLRKFLEKLGLQVHEATNGQEAVEYALTHQPAIILLDAQMPVLNGFEACMQIKQAFPDLDVQVLMLTASDDPEMIEKAFEAGVTDYLVKPINWTLLKYRISHEMHVASTYKAVRINEARLRTLFEQAPVGFAVCSLTPPYQISNANPAFIKLVQQPQIKGTALLDFIPQEDHPLFEQAFKLTQAGQSGEATFRLDIPKRSHPIFVHFHGQLIISPVDGTQEMLCIFEDITDRILTENKLKALATTDPLTGLLNRRAFEELAETWLQQAHHHRLPLSLIILDIDHFKQINDTYGHPIGDEVLQHLAKLMRENALREDDIIARYGGEEFIILLPKTTLKDASHVAERLRIKVEDTKVHTPEGEIRFTISLGVACLSETEDTLDTLIKHADEALYQAKHNGRNRVELFDLPCLYEEENI